MNQYWIYILCSKRNGTLYVGFTGEIETRVYQHKIKEFTGFTSKYNVNKDRTIIVLKKTNDYSIFETVNNTWKIKANKSDGFWTIQYKCYWKNFFTKKKIALVSQTLYHYKAVSKLWSAWVWLLSEKLIKCFVSLKQATLWNITDRRCINHSQYSQSPCPAVLDGSGQFITNRQIHETSCN